MPKYLDAQKMHIKHPDTFYAPSAEELSAIAAGSIVKVSTGNERFWVDVKSVDGKKITGTVNSHVVCTDAHGLVCGDMVQFSGRNVLQIN